MRKAVREMRDATPELARNDSPATEADGPRGTVRVDLCIPHAYASALASRARTADVARSTYVCALLDDLPPSPDHAASVAALMISTDRLAAMSSDLNAFLRVLGRVPAAELAGYRAGIQSLTADVRKHLACAAALIAELRPALKTRR